MILVDTSVWVDHFAKGEPELVALLNAGSVVCHPFVIGELACGTMRNRQEILRMFRALPSAPQVEPDEFLAFVEFRSLMGRGLGNVDVHLLASSILAGAALWTKDRRLNTAAQDLKISHEG